MKILFLIIFTSVLLFNLGSCWRRRRRNPPPPPPRVNGGWSGWGPFGACTRTCGGGTMVRYRSCNNPPPANGGSYCPGTNQNAASCNTHGCPVDGGWSAWGSYGSCSKTCGGGVRIRYRQCNNPSPRNGGMNCQKASSESKPCNTHICPEEPNSPIITASDGTKYQLVGCFANYKDRMQQLLLTERDHTSHAWNGQWIQWNNWNNYMAAFINRCTLKVTARKYKVFGMSYYGECWSGDDAKNALALYTKDLKDLSRCVTEGYKDCKIGDTRCIGKHFGIAVYQLIET